MHVEFGLRCDNNFVFGWYERLTERMMVSLVVAVSVCGCGTSLRSRHLCVVGFGLHMRKGLEKSPLPYVMLDSDKCRRSSRSSHLIVIREIYGYPWGNSTSLWL